MLINYIKTFTQYVDFNYIIFPQQEFGALTEKYQYFSKYVSPCPHDPDSRVG